MKTRMEKYYNEDITKRSRTAKNASLYKDVNNAELEDFNLNSNISILGDNSDNINLDEIQEILDKKYHEEPRRKPLIDINSFQSEPLEIDETREYDINAILDKAKENKEVDYEVDRLKKLRNTQYDILNNLNLDSKPKKNTPTNENDLTNEQAKLMELINTITSKELGEKVSKEKVTESQELDPLELFSDLKGNDEETKVLGIIDEVNKELEKTKENKVVEPTKEFKVEPKKEETTKEIAEKSAKELENSFYNSTQIQFSQSDFDDFNDLKDDMKATKIVIKILIVLVIIAFIVGCVFLANNIFNLGLF